MPSGKALISPARLAEFWLFSRVPDPQALQGVCNAAKTVHVGRGQAAVTAGARCLGAIVVVRGTLQVRRPGAPPDEPAVRTWEEGQVLGGLNLHGPQRRWPFTVETGRPNSSFDHTPLPLHKPSFLELKAFSTTRD